MNTRAGELLSRSRDRLVTILAVAVVLLFAAAWIWISVQILLFQPTVGQMTMEISEAQVTLAGFLASAVGAGTASSLGIEIGRAGRAPGTGQDGSPATGGSGGGATRVAAGIEHAVKESTVLAVGILTYAGVGVFVLVVWFFKSEVAPDMVGAFSLGVLGWLSGAFAAVFRRPS